MFTNEHKIIYFFNFILYFSTYAANLTKIIQNEQCVIILSDENTLATNISKTLWNSTLNSVIHMNSTIFYQDYDLFCQPTTYIMIFQQQNDVDRLTRNIFMLKTHTKLFFMGKTSLNTTKLEEMCFIRFINMFYVNFTTDNVNMDIKDNNNYIEHNLNRKLLKVLWFSYGPYVYESNGRINGIEPKILTHLAQEMTLNYVYFDNKTWTGQILHLVDNTADISISGHWLSQILALGGEATVQYASLSSTFLIPRPGLLPATTYVFQTLNSKVWILLIFTIIIYSAILHLVDWVLTNFMHKNTNRIYGRKDYNYIIIIISYLTMTPTPQPSKYSIIRLLILFWTIIAIILTTSFSAGLSSIAMIPRRYKPIETMTDLAEADIPCYTLEYYIRDLLKESELKSAQKVASNMFAREHSPSPGACICQEVVVLHDNILIPSYLDELNEETLMLFKENLHETYNVIALAKNSPYKKIFNRKLNQLMEHGFITKWISEEKSQTSIADVFKGFQLKIIRKQSLQLYKLQGAFILLFIGDIIAFVAFLHENYVLQ